MSLRLQLSRPDSVHILYVSEDRAEAHLLVQRFDELTGAEKAGHGFLALRRVQFSDETLLISWCHSSACSTPTELGSTYKGLHYRHSCATEHLGNHQPLCPCGQAIVLALGEQWLQDVLQCQSVAPASQPLLLDVVIKARSHVAVRAGSALEDWGLVQLAPGGVANCTTCPSRKQHCSHVNAWRKSQQGEEVEAPSTTLPTAEYEQELSRFIDLENGAQRLSSTCLSRLQIPKSVDDMPAVAHALRGTHRPLPCNEKQ